MGVVFYNLRLEDSDIQSVLECRSQLVQLRSARPHSSAAYLVLYVFSAYLAKYCFPLYYHKWQINSKISVRECAQDKLAQNEEACRYLLVKHGSLCRAAKGPMSQTVQVLVSLMCVGGVACVGQWRALKEPHVIQPSSSSILAETYYCEEGGLH